MATDDVKKQFTALKGVGDAKAQLLIENGFDTLEKLQKATVKQLTGIEGISEKNAQDILKQVKAAQKTSTSPKKPASSQKTKDKTPSKGVSKKEQPSGKSPVKKIPETTTQPSTKEASSTDDVQIVEETKKVKVKIKPKLSEQQKKQLEQRKQIKKRTPTFLREEWFRYKRIPKNWRRPDGLTSKMRKHLKYRPNVVSIGYRGPKQVRGLHPSGFQEILIHNVSDLERLNPDTQAARISSTVGTKKRMAIAKKAEERNIRVLNRGV